MGLIGKILVTILVAGVMEGIALGAVTFSFLESIKTSFVFYRQTSDNNSQNVLKGISRIAEPYVHGRKMAGLDDVVRHFIKKSEVSPDRLLIKEIFIISPDAILLSHSSREKKDKLFKLDEQYRDPLYTRANKMNRWKVTIPREIAKLETNDVFFKYLLKYIPQLQGRQFLISAPIYHPAKFSVIGSAHMVYELDNLVFFMEKQKAVYLWLLGDIALLTLIAAVILSWSLLSVGKQKLVQQLPPIIQKVVIPKPESIVESRADVSETDQAVETEEIVAESVVEKIDSISSEKPVLPNPPVVRKVKEVKDAIYIGK